MTDFNDMPPLPKFLDRKKWTKADQARSTKVWTAMTEKIRKEQEVEKARKAKEAIELKAKLEAEEKARQARQAVLKARAEKKKAKTTAQHIAFNMALEKGSITVIQLRKALPDALKKYARWAIRDAFKQGKLKRKGRKVYVL